MRSLVRSFLYTAYRAVPLKREITTRSVFGDRYITPMHDDIGRALFKRRIHEPGISRWIHDTVRPEAGGLVVDAGANFGYYSVLLSRLASGTHTVLAFEPEPYNYRLLTRNIQLNGARNILPINCALGDRSEQKDLVLYKASNRGRHSLLDLHRGDRVRVSVRPLDELLDERGLSRARIALLKIDVEGYEILVLQGAERAVGRCRYVILEYSPRYFDRSPLGADFFERFVRRCALRCYAFTEAGPSEIAVERLAASAAQMDLLLMRDGES